MGKRCRPERARPLHLRVAFVAATAPGRCGCPAHCNEGTGIGSGRRFLLGLWIAGIVGRARPIPMPLRLAMRADQERLGEEAR
jgi:hypothetical protein